MRVKAQAEQFSAIPDTRDKVPCIQVPNPVENSEMK